MATEPVPLRDGEMVNCSMRIVSIKLGVATVYHVLETTICSLSIVLNVFLLFLIKNYSTFRIRMYQILLAIDASLDLSLSIVALFAQQTGFSGDGYFIVITNGFFAHSSYTYDSVMLIALAALILMNVLWIPVQFIFRYVFLCRSEEGTSLRKLISVLAVVAISWNALGIYVFCLLFSPPSNFQPTGLRVLEMNGWPIGAGVTPPVFGGHLTDVRLIAWAALWFVSTASAATIVAFCEYKIIRHFKSLGFAQHETTRRMNRDFHRALLALAICPLVTTGIPIGFFLSSICFSLSPGYISAFVTTGVTCITMFNPLTTIFFMRCYRDVVLRCFRKAPNHVTAVSTVASLAAAPH